jgi:phosphoribosylaminoimidazolecarboxamide formyltransferase/IMP cyclohydrolase
MAAGLGRATRWRLARAAFAVTAAYDAGIATTLESIVEPVPHGVPAIFDDDAMPPVLRVIEKRQAVLRYGENPHQKAALYVDGSGRGVAAAKQLQGKELSYNNIVDLDACWELVSEFDAARMPRLPSSSTPTRAGRRPARAWPRPTGGRWRQIRFRRSAA